jgi:hypothetical protein
MSVRFGRPLVVVLVLMGAFAISISSNSQQPICNPRNISVSVKDSTGYPVSDLSTENFHAMLGRRTLVVSKATPRPALHRIIFVIHMSGRMRTGASIQISLSLAASMVKRAPTGVEFALVTFNDDAYWDQPFTSDRDSFVTKLQSLDDARKWIGASALFDAVGFSVQKVAPPSEGDAIVLISNGIDNESKTKFNSEMENVSNSHIHIFAIGISPADQLTTWKEDFRDGQQHLDEFAAVSGGESFGLGPPDFLRDRRGLHMELRVESNLGNIQEIADSILREMSTGYLLEIALPPPVRKPVVWKLDVNNSAGESLQLSYPKKLYPCPIGSKN